MKILRLIAIVAIAGILAAACSFKKSIVGKWQDIGGTERLEFIDGGTLSISNGQRSASGKYAFIDDSHLSIELGGLMALAGPQIVTVSISEGVLSLTDPQGKVSKYNRVQ